MAENIVFHWAASSFFGVAVTYRTLGRAHVLRPPASTCDASYVGTDSDIDGGSADPHAPRASFLGIVGTGAACCGHTCRTEGLRFHHQPGFDYPSVPQCSIPVADSKVARRGSGQRFGPRVHAYDDALLGFPILVVGY